MAHSYYAVYEHTVFSSKNRIPFLTSENEEDVFRYLASSLKGQGCCSLAVGGHVEHIHLLYRRPSTLPTPDLLKEVKRQSGISLKENNKLQQDFYWQEGYGAFSISYWDLEKIGGHINKQKMHHEDKSWEKEYRQLLKKHGVEYDERFFLD